MEAGLQNRRAAASVPSLVPGFRLVAIDSQSMKELQAQHAGVSVVQVPPNMRVDLYRACVGESPVLLTQQDMLIAATDSRAIIVMHMDSRARLFNMSV